MFRFRHRGNHPTTRYLDYLYETISSRLLPLTSISRSSFREPSLEKGVNAHILKAFSQEGWFFGRTSKLSLFLITQCRLIVAFRFLTPSLYPSMRSLSRHLRPKDHNIGTFSNLEVWAILVLTSNHEYHSNLPQHE